MSHEREGVSMHIIFNSYKDMWTKTINFKGRSTNEEYWWPSLVNFLITLLCIYIFKSGLMAFLYNAFITIPVIALSIRRMHDINKSGWNILWLYIPTVILLIYAGSILYYTQRPEIVDMFLKWFTVMVVGYVVVIVYSVYLLTHHTYPKKNHYGDVPTVTSKTKAAMHEDDLLEAMEGKNIEDTLSFKTKAFIEKAKSHNHKEEQTSETVPLEKIKEEPIKAVEKPKAKKEKPIEKPIEILKVTKEQLVTDEPIIAQEIKMESKKIEKEDIIVRAQLKPSKKSTVKRTNTPETPVKKAVEVSKDILKVELESTLHKEEEKEVKTLAQKRAEVQNSAPKIPIVIENNEVENKAVKTETKIIHRPIKRKVIQPIEMPDMNVEKIRTHSLDSIAKLVEQNMTKNPKDAPTVVATVKRRPVKRKVKKDE